MKVLAIESSCDDTSFAVVNDDKKVDFHETINHRKFHREHGGVVPEMAARQHLDIMDHLSKFQKKINFANIDAIASTYGPGLIGGLIVGSSFAKGLALSHQKRIIPINHLQAHLLSPRLVSKLSFPYLCLLVSGGNTALVLVKSARKFIRRIFPKLYLYAFIISITIAFLIFYHGMIFSVLFFLVSLFKNSLSLLSTIV